MKTESNIQVETVLFFSVLWLKSPSCREALWRSSRCIGPDPMPVKAFIHLFSVYFSRPFSRLTEAEIRRKETPVRCCLRRHSDIDFDWPPNDHVATRWGALYIRYRQKFQPKNIGKLRNRCTYRRKRHFSAKHAHIGRLRT